MYAKVITKGVTDFANNCELLKYGLHWDAVISRWAREHANEVGTLDVTKKAIYTNISQFLFTFHQIPCKLGEQHKTSLGLRWGFDEVYEIIFYPIHFTERNDSPASVNGSPYP